MLLHNVLLLWERIGTSFLYLPAANVKACADRCADCAMHEGYNLTATSGK